MALKQQLLSLYGTEKAATPVAVFVSDWIQEKYSKGCYASYFPPHLLTKIHAILPTILPYYQLQTSDMLSAKLDATIDHNDASVATTTQCNISGPNLFLCCSDLSSEWRTYMAGAVRAGNEAAAQVISTI